MVALFISGSTSCRSCKIDLDLMETQLEKTIQIVAFGMIAEFSPARSDPGNGRLDTDALRADLIASFPQLTDLPFVIAVRETWKSVMGINLFHQARPLLCCHLILEDRF